MPRIGHIPLDVIMIPLDKKRKIYPPAFPPYPRLYLDLLANKEKLKAEFKNSEFVPKYGDSEIIFDDEGEEKVKEVKKENRNDKKGSEKGKDDKKGSEKGKDDKKGSEKGRKFKKKEEEVLVDDLLSDKPSRDDGKREEGKKEEGNREEKQKRDDEQKKSDDPLADFLQKDGRSLKNKKNSPSDSKHKSYEKKKEELLKDSRKLPPSLADLEDGGAFEGNGIKDASRISRREQDQEQKLREYLFKFELLKRSYPNEDLPKFTINSDPEFVAKTYDDLLKNFALTDTIGKYKKFLMFGFMGVEGFMGNILGFDMKGFTKQQIIEMGSYEKLLIELGEKSYVPKSNWPVELRLLGMIIMNAAFFVGARMAFKSTGTDILGAMNTASNAGVQINNIQQRKKQKMEGPNINLDDIPGVSSPPPSSSGDPQFVKK